MTREQIENYCQEFEATVKFMDGYDDCIVGLVERFGQEPIVCYDFEKVIQKLISQGMTDEEAHEWYDYNQLGTWVGKETPCFLLKEFYGI